MKNGNAFLAFIEESAAFLSGLKSIDFYQEPLPSQTDETLDRMVHRFQMASPRQREQFQAALTQGQRSLFGVYGHRAATLAVRETAPDRLTRGLVGVVIANYVIPEKRQVEVGLAIFHHCARKLEMNVIDLFEDVAQYANEGFASRLLAFGRRPDVTLKKYGWRELNTPEGVKYTFSWG
jgi:hypothetical protein